VAVDSGQWVVVVVMTAVVRRMLDGLAGQWVIEGGQQVEYEPVDEDELLDELQAVEEDSEEELVVLDSVVVELELEDEVVSSVSF
jgi:hypothetical protein